MPMTLGLYLLITLICWPISALLNSLMFTITMLVSIGGSDRNFENVMSVNSISPNDWLSGSNASKTVRFEISLNPINTPNTKSVATRQSIKNFLMLENNYI